jgi:hypothetical protein
MKIPDSPTAFICVTFLAEWFELAGEQEVSCIETISVYFLFLNAVYTLFDDILFSA